MMDRRPELVPENAPKIDWRAIPSVRVRTDVGSLWLHAKDEVMTPLIADNGWWEYKEAALAKAFLDPGMHALDIGANIGYYSLLFAKAVGSSGRVLAIEPEPRNFALLEANLRGGGITNVQTIQAAAGDFNGSIDLALSSMNRGDHRILPSDTCAEKIQVPCVRIDDVLSGEAIDLVKIDIQGAEHLAIKGMETLLARSRPVVIAEFFPEAITSLGFSPIEVLSYYQSIGFSPKLLEAPDVDYKSLGLGALVYAASAQVGGFGTLIMRPDAELPQSLVHKWHELMTDLPPERTPIAWPSFPNFGVLGWRHEARRVPLTLDRFFHQIANRVLGQPLY